MQIDFNGTYDQNGKVVFVNKDGNDMISYPMSELEQFVESKQLNVSYDNESEYCVSGDSRDPRNWDNKEVETVQPVSEYIDDNWSEVTEMFYHSLNKSEFKSNNGEQQTRRVCE